MSLENSWTRRYACGVRSEALQKKLLTEADLTMTRAQEIGQGMECADQGARDLKGEAATRSTEEVNVAAAFAKSSPRVKCHRCGRRHDPKQCKFKDAICHKCGKPGHISPACLPNRKPASS